MSNALLVSAADSASGHPLAVMGPQVSYFSPQILMEEDIHGPGIDAEGAAFPGVNLYVELGHGPDYAWSATSAGQNIIDTFAAPLCNPSGGTVSMDSDYYMLNGQCVQMETLTRTESWQPNLGDSTPAGSVTFQTKRTAYGIVIARARIKGQPVVYTNLRSTYMHELDSALGFEQFNEPAEMRNPQDFMNAAYNIGYTFNWFYTDDKNIAYFNSGLNPVRAANTDPLFPSWASDAWKGFHPAAQMTPASVTEQQTPESAHPQAVNQPYLTSWNNKQAPGLQRRRHRPGVRLGLPLAAARQQHQLRAGGVREQDDARGPDQRDGDRRDPGPARRRGAAVRAPDHRPSERPDARDRGQRAAGVGGERRAPHQPRACRAPSGDYDQTDAVRIMDAWWPLLVSAEFGPTLGSSLLGQVESDFPINDEPGHGVSGAHLGSAFDVGFYGIVQKDLRSVLGRQGRRPAESRVLRRRIARQVPGGARELAAPGGAGVARRRSIRPTACAPPATRCARTRSSSGRSA